MKYHQPNEDLYIEIGASVFNQIQLQAKGEYPNENGGMLAGRYSVDRRTVYIEKVVVPIEKITCRTSFVRNTRGLEKEWERLAKEGLRYVGEWHSHPNGSTHFSETDLIAMVEIEREVVIGNPILLIIAVKREGLSAHAFYCYKNNMLMEYKKMVDLKDLFQSLQHQMFNSLDVDRHFISHTGCMGDATEHQWIEFLTKYLPSRYKVDKAIVIDSFGNVSEQIDIVVYDSFYTPFIFNQDGFKYIPAESVYAVFEVKQDLSGNIEYASKKIESVRKLKRTSIDMVSSGRTQKARLLTKIVGGILTTSCSYKEKSTIKNHLKELRGYGTIDMGCCCNYGSFYVDYEEIEPTKHEFSGEIEINRIEIEKIYNSRSVKDIQFSTANNSLFTFFLQLVSYLKSIGTVPAIDVNAYLKAIHERVDEEI